MSMISVFVAASIVAAQSALDPAGPLAGRIDSLTRLMIYLLSAIFIVVMIVLAFAAFRRRRRDTPDSSANNANVIAPEHDREKRLSHTVTGAVAVSVLVLFGLLTASYLVGRAIYLGTGRQINKELTIEVNGRP